MLFSNIKANWKKKAICSIFALLLASPIFAQGSENAGSSSETLLIIVLSLVLVVAILILIIGLYLISIIKMIMQEDKKQKALTAGEEYIPEEEPSIWNKLIRKASDVVPIEEEESILLDHDYDGIHELDNHLPPWWKGLFYVTIIFAVVYLFVYHIFGALPLSHQEYDIVMEKARLAREAAMAAEGNNIDENNVEFSDAADVISSGKAIFERECVACHAPEGQGLIGPNLTDEYWLHGGSINEIFHTIKYGVPQKGMISWQAKLSPKDIQDVACFVMSLQGTTPKNPPPPKAPQGEKYVPKSSTDQNQTDQNPAEQPAES